jgi:DNA-binding transcriptional ArsR family regulator
MAHDGIPAAAAALAPGDPTTHGDATADRAAADRAAADDGAAPEPATLPMEGPSPAGRAKPRRPATDAEARALASAVRLRIMRLCLDRALTNKEIAQLLGANPATTLHHVRTLVATGFIAPQEERRGTRGAREVPYLATGKSWTLDVGEHRVEGANKAMVDAFLDEIAHLDLDAPPSSPDELDPVGVSRLGLRLSHKDLCEMADRIGEILNEYALRPADMRDGVPYSVFFALYRDVTRP